MFNPGDLSAAELRTLDGIWLAVAETADARAACDLLTRQLAALLGVPVAVLRRDLDTWRLESEAPASSGEARPPIPTAPPAVERQAGAAPLDLRDAGSHWTGVPLGGRTEPAWILLLPGESSLWRSVPWFEHFTRELSLALQISASKEAEKRREELVLRTYAFTRELARVTRDRHLHQFVLDSVAAAVKAEIGALAMYRQDEASLAISATHGYPAVLVEHVRIAPGAGVMGGVFASRQPLLVRDVGLVSGLHPQRARYRTRSFMTLPLMGGEAALGVISLADRADGKPFERTDLTTVRALAAPAALALAHERLLAQTRDLARAATVDPLTGLHNRRYFHTRFEEEIQRAGRYGLDLALLIVDLDGFKAVNDTLGHLAGDAVLQSVAEVLRRAVRVFDVCTRYGGDEFAILMPGSNAESAMHSAERIRRRVEVSRPEAFALPEAVRLTVSVGLAVLSAEVSWQELIARADKALYRAKADGKNCVRLAGG